MAFDKATIRWAEANNISINVIGRLESGNLSHEEKMQLLKPADTRPWILEILGEDASSYIRRHVASHVNTSQKVLLKMATCESTYIKLAVAKNTQTIDALHNLAHDRDPLVREEVARNPNTNQNKLKVLSMDCCPFVSSVAKQRLREAFADAKDRVIDVACGVYDIGPSGTLDEEAFNELIDAMDSLRYFHDINEYLTD